MNNRHLIKYLNQYSEPLIQSLTTKINDCERLSTLLFDDVVVIPAYKENSAFISRFLASTLAKLNVLVIIVINQPDYDQDKQPQRELLDYILSTGEHIVTVDSVTFVSPEHAQCHLCCIDAFTTEIPAQQGVGLARKLGTDLAVLLKANNQITSDWIHSTDADAELPDDYFSVVKALCAKQNTAVSYNFAHHSENGAIHQANQQYETALRYYLAGMNFAKSSYAFFTIGSVIAFTAQGYVQVRGFPKRSAGEDFYLLNKLAKLGKVHFLEDTVINIQARESNRVPFGTGPTVSKIMELNRSGESYFYYHPQLFTELKHCLQHFNTLWEQRLTLPDWLSHLSKEAQQSLIENGFEKFVLKQGNTNQVQFNKQLLVWFDAFKTLKFLHGLRERKYTDIPLDEALQLAEFCNA